jgi:SMC interacting uncharacterized protein involved in chromosome segregation
MSIQNLSLESTMAGDENGWGEYSRLVLKELETLALGMASLQKELELVKSELAALKAKEDKVQELVQWKQRIDDVASPVQLKELVDACDDFKMFKTKAVTIFVVAQTVVALALGFISKIL